MDTTLTRFLNGHKDVWLMLQVVGGLEVCTLSTRAKVVTITDERVTLELAGGMVTLTEMAGTVKDGAARFMDGRLTMEVR